MLTFLVQFSWWNKLRRRGNRVGPLDMKTLTGKQSDMVRRIGRNFYIVHARLTDTRRMKDDVTHHDNDAVGPPNHRFCK